MNTYETNKEKVQRLRAAVIKLKQEPTDLPFREYSSSEAEKIMKSAIRDILKVNWNRKPISSLSEFKKDLYIETMPLVEIYLSVFEISVSTTAFNEAWFKEFQTLYQNEGLYIIEPELEV